VIWIKYFGAMILATSLTACAQPVETISNEPVANIFASEPVIYQIGLAACKGDADEAKRLFNASKVNINTKFPLNRGGIKEVTVLYWVTGCNNVDGVRALLELGADPNMKLGDDFSSTWHASGFGGRKELLPLMIKHGGNLNQEDDNGINLLMRAYETGSMDNFNYLLEQGVDINYVTSDNITIIEYVNWNNSIILQLLQHGANVHLDRVVRNIASNCNEWIRDYPEGENGKNCVAIRKILIGKGLTWPDTFTPIL
jgi:ankyrin repeat protein